MSDVRLVDLDVFKRYSLAIRQESAPVEEVLAVLDATRRQIEAALALRRPPAPPPEAPAAGDLDDGDLDGDEAFAPPASEAALDDPFERPYERAYAPLDEAPLEESFAEAPAPAPAAEEQRARRRPRRAPAGDDGVGGRSRGRDR